jgi:hypothetical protein
MTRTVATEITGTKLAIIRGVVMFQIDGRSGTGRSTLYAELERRGYYVVDSDTVFAYYGDPVTGAPSDVESRENWLWDGQKLREFAQESSDARVFICGGAMKSERAPAFIYEAIRTSRR